MCAGCNKLAMCRAHLGHIEQSASPWQKQKHHNKLWEKEDQKYILCSKHTHIPFFCRCKEHVHFFPHFSFLFLKQLGSHTTRRQIRHEWASTVFPPVMHKSGGNKITADPCTSCPWSSPVRYPISKAVAAGKASGCCSHGVRATSSPSSLQPCNTSKIVVSVH